MHDDANGSVLELGRYLQVLRRRWYAPVLGVLLAFLGAMAYLDTTPTSATATATVDLNVVSSDPFDLSRPAADLLNPVTETQTAGSPDVVRSVSEAQGLEVAEVRANLTAEVLADSTVMRISYTAATAAAARSGADALAQSYLSARTQAADDRVTRLATRLENRRGALRDQLATAIGEVNKAKGTALTRAQSEEASLRAELENLVQRITALNSIDTTGGRMLASASDNTIRTAPDRVLTIVTGVLGGLVLGLLAAFLIDVMDRRIRDRHDVREAGAGRVLARMGSSECRVPARAGDAVAVRTVREHLLAALPASRGVLTVADVGGSAPSDVGINLAVAMAELGVATELILAQYPESVLDRLREPLDLRRRPEDVAGVQRYQSATYPSLVVDVPLATDTHLDTSSIVVSSVMRREEGDRHTDDLLIIAHPPDVSRSLLLTAARISHSVLLAASAGTTRKRDLEAIASELESVNAVIHGTVLQGRRRKWPKLPQARQTDQAPDTVPIEG